MTLADEDIWVLYQAEKAAYYAYVAALGGETLVKGQRVSGKKVGSLRQEWLKQLRALRRRVTPAEIQGMLQRRGAGGGEGSAEAEDRARRSESL